MGLFRRKRVTEATDEQLAATGATGYYYDPVDRDLSFRSTTANGPRQIPARTLEQARSFSIAGYRSNPMARAIIDTYCSFCVGDSGLTLQCTNDDVREHAERFWNDPANCFDEQDIMLRSYLLHGESVYEMLVGQMSGVVQRSVIDPSRICGVDLDRGNALWPAGVHIRQPGADPAVLDLIRMDPFSELRTGQAFFWRGFRALETDLRGAPFLMPVLDWLDNYDQVLSNLIDRTALARYLALHIKLGGTAPGGGPWDQAAIDEYVKNRGASMPRSGSVEVTNDNVDIQPINAQSGAFEDTETTGTILTSVAAGAGLAKTWLADPVDSNRATSLTMAEPVRRRVGGVQNVWLRNLTEMLRFVVDRAVAARLCDPMVDIQSDGGKTKTVPAAMTVSVTGPEVAAADAQVTATVLANLSQSLTTMVAGKLLSLEAAQHLAQQAWEGFAGVPWKPELATADAIQDDIATHVDDNAATAKGAPLAQLVSA